MKKPLCVLLLLLIALSLSAQKKPILTVLDFKKEGVSDQEMRSILSLLTSSLFKTGKFTVIDLAQRETLLKEIEFSSSGCSDEACQLQIGKMLSAEFIVVGSLGKVGSKWILATKLLATESSQTEATADGVYADLDKLIEDLPQIALKIAGQETGGKAATVTPAPAGAPVDWKLWGGIGGLAVGVAAAGTGAYFILDALDFRSTDVAAAESAYKNAQLGGGSDFAALHDAYLALFDEYMNELILGIGLAAGGAAVSGLSSLLFLPSEKQGAVPAVSVYFHRNPATGNLSVGFTYRRALP